MRYFFDTEFFEDGKTIDLISIGVVAEDGRTFYAISSEFDVDRVLDDPWMRDHVWSFIKDDYEHGNTLSREEIAVKFLDFVAPHHHWDILHMIPLMIRSYGDITVLMIGWLFANYMAR